MSFGFDFCGGDGGIPIAAKDISKIEAQPKHDINVPGSSNYGPAPGSSSFGPSQGRPFSPAMLPSGAPDTPGQGYRASPIDGEPGSGTPSMTPATTARRSSFIASLFSLPGSATSTQPPSAPYHSQHPHPQQPHLSSNPGPSGTPFSTPSDGLQSRSLFSSSSATPSGASITASYPSSGSFSGIMAGQTPPVKPMAAPTMAPPALPDERKTGRDF